MSRARWVVALLVGACVAAWSVHAASGGTAMSRGTSFAIEEVQSLPGVDSAECSFSGDTCADPGDPLWSCELDPELGFHVRVLRGVCP